MSFNGEHQGVGIAIRVGQYAACCIDTFERNVVHTLGDFREIK